MDLRIDRSSREPVSTQLRRGVGEAVDAGRLLPGDRLPTIRELASRLDVAPNTVAKAYRELELDGVVKGRGRRGTFVASRQRPTPSQEAALRRAADRFATQAAGMGFGMAQTVGEVRRAFARRRSGTS